LLPEFRQEQAIVGAEWQDNGSGTEPVDFDFSAFSPLPLVDENHVNPTDFLTAPSSDALSGYPRADSDSGYGSMGYQADFAKSLNDFNNMFPS
jgi:hypothetical protein